MTTNAMEFWHQIDATIGQQQRFVARDERFAIADRAISRQHVEEIREVLEEWRPRPTKSDVVFCRSLVLRHHPAIGEFPATAHARSSAGRRD